MRFVFDTNVLVSALLLANSTPQRAFDRAVEAGRILISLATLEELNNVLGQERFRKYVTLEESHLFLAGLVKEAEWVEVRTSVTACRDPRDNKFLEVAVDGNASHLVTGDSDLLALNPFRGVTILTPQAFLEITFPAIPSEDS